VSKKLSLIVPSRPRRLVVLHPVDDHDPMAHVEEPADTWENHKENGTPKQLVP